MAIETVIVARSPSYVGQIFLQEMGNLLSSSSFPSHLFWDTPGGQTPNVHIELFGAWPEQPVRYPSIIAVVSMGEVAMPGFEAGGITNDNTDFGDTSDFHQSLVYLYSTGTATLSCVSPQYECALRMVSMVSVLVMNRTFRRNLEQYGITLTTPNVRFTQISTLEFGMEKRFMASANLDFRTEGLVGQQFTPPDTPETVQDVQSDSGITP